VKQSIRISR